MHRNILGKNKDTTGFGKSNFEFAVTSYKLESPDLNKH